MNINISWELDPDYPGRAWPVKAMGLLSLNGLHMHATALRVRDVHGIQTAWQIDFELEVDALTDMCGTRLQTTNLPGLEGDWVLALYPHGD